MNKHTGGLVISIDFEMYWGVRDKTLTDRRYLASNVAQVPQVVERTCQLFEQYGIRATWATVGLLFARNHAEASEITRGLQGLAYRNPDLNPLSDLQPGEPPRDVPERLLFAPDLVQRVANTAGQEIGSHTFSHYYLLEPGQRAEDFQADCELFAKVSGNDRAVSMVFPRNQVNLAYLPILRRAGIHVFRGVQRHWAYAAAAGDQDGYARRAFRWLDKYLPLGGDHSFPASLIRRHDGLLELPQSRFLAPYSRRWHLLEGRRVGRIRREMQAAARAGRYYHLWWHPHNFGANTEQNFAILESLLKHFYTLRQTYHWPSLRMDDFLEKTR